jgi:hypothetical protein
MSVYRGSETQVLRAKCSNAGLQAWADCVRPSRVPTSMIEHTKGKSPGPINISDQSRVNVRLCHDVRQPQQTLAASAQTILLLEMLKLKTFI